MNRFIPSAAKLVLAEWTPFETLFRGERNRRDILSIPST